MGEFVGKRVVPDHVGLWSQDKVYEPLMIVLNGATGDSYISRRAVPVGISLSDESYWSLCAHYSAQMRKLEQDVETDVQQMHSDVDAAQSAMSREMADTKAAISRELTETHDAIGRELTETEQRVESSLQETTAQVTQQVSAARSELNTGRQELKDTREVLSSRMDSIVGGATSDTEVLDARVGVDGKVYENLGTHIRSGFAAVYDENQNAMDRLGRLAEISDAMRQANLVHTMSYGVKNADGELLVSSSSLGHGDRAGVRITGRLSGDEKGTTVLRFTEPIAFKAGVPYTVFIDETTPKAGYAVYFYEDVTGACLQVNGTNRGFSPAVVISTAVFDRGGLFRAGVYSTNCEFENHEIHLYVIEGAYTRQDFAGLAGLRNVSANLSAAAAVRDSVRQKNLIQTRQVTLKNTEGETYLTAVPGGVINPAAVVLNGKVDIAVNSTTFQLSLPFTLEAEKDYTLLVQDQSREQEYSVYLLDETDWKDVLENGATKEFNVLHNPCGVIPKHQTGRYHLRMCFRKNVEFADHALQVYLVEGAYAEHELRAFYPAEDGAQALRGMGQNLVSLSQVSDFLRKNNLIRTYDNQGIGTDGEVCVRAVSTGLADPSGVVFSGTFGARHGVTTVKFAEPIWLDKDKTYTLFIRTNKESAYAAIYFYGNSKSGCMQVGGYNRGFDINAVRTSTFVPDESAFYRAGLYSSDSITLEDLELHLYVVEGSWTYDIVRGLVEFNDLNRNLTGMAGIADAVRRSNLVYTANYTAQSEDGQYEMRTRSQGYADQAAVRLEGWLGAGTGLNSLRCTALFDLTGGKTYTLYVSAGQDCPPFSAYVGDENTYLGLQAQGKSVVARHPNQCVCTFTPEADVPCRIRLSCTNATEFTGQVIRLYVVEGTFSETEIRSYATFAELNEARETGSKRLGALSVQEDERWTSAYNAMENALTVSDRVRAGNLVRTCDNERRDEEDAVRIHCMACGMLDRASVIVDGEMSSEIGIGILQLTEPMHLEQGKRYTVRIVDTAPPYSYSMFFYNAVSGACLQQGGTNRGISPIGGRLDTLIPDTTGDYRMGIYSTGVRFSQHLIHAYVLEGDDWSLADFSAYPQSAQIAESASEMAAIRDSIRLKNLIRMTGGRGFNGGEPVYTLTPVGMPDQAGLILDGGFGADHGVTYLNISDAFPVEAGKTYSFLVRDEDKSAEYTLMLVDKTSGTALKQNGATILFHVQNSPSGTFTPDTGGLMRLRINFRKSMSCERHILHVYLVEGSYRESEMLAFAQEKEEEGFPYENYNLPVLKLTGMLNGISKDNKVPLTYVYGDLSGSCTLKWQGASSIAYDKKNFTLSFDTSQTIQEKWGAQKKYCLKANYVDFSHCRNIVAARLWGQAVRSRPTKNSRLYDLPNGGAIDGFPIMLVINEVYQGLYTFNIPKDKWMFGMGAGDREAILTAETHAKATQFAEEAKVDKTDFEMEYVPDEEDTQWVKDSINTLIRAVMEFDGETAADVESLIGPYVDLESAVDYFLITSMFALTDNLDKNYILATFDGVRWAFSEYDLDTAFGNCWNGKVYYNPMTVVTFKGFANAHKLMGILYNCYRDKLKSRYAALRKTVLSEVNVQMTVVNFLVDIPKALLDQEALIWPKIPGTNTNNMTQILDWYRLRCIAMDAEMEAL